MKWTSQRIRDTFLAYFEARGHRRTSSLALVPPGDATLLFTNAGMVQFKDVFTGERQVDYDAACSAQKCLRVSGKHNDLENVGRTARHHTLFEMLGNFSFGRYFKEEAIQCCWELLTTIYKLPIDKLYVTVHPDDDEARALWCRISDLPNERIIDDPDNFWSMGDTGPCGPCSEVYLDQGSALSGGRDVSFEENGEGDRYVELWNLVFMQYDRDVSGALTPLPNPCIDTGMGLDRLTAVLQGMHTNYDSDLFQPLIQRAAALAGVKYGADDESDVALRVIADHSRAAAFLIADGVYPSNEGRGYVNRRLMRRAMRFGRKLGLTDAFLVETTAEVVRQMGDVYPELREKETVIHDVVLREEASFGRTLAAGLKRLEKGFSEFSGKKEIPGKVAFELYDTHGFPLDLTQQAAGERGFSVDVSGFNEAMEAQRASGRASWSGGADDLSEWEAIRGELDRPVRFTGYEEDEGTALVRAVAADGTYIVTDETPFYAESGGQAGDTGSIRSSESVFRVTDTKGPLEGLVVHHGAFEGDGAFEVGESVTLQIDSAERNLTRKNHSATHLLHFALREVLGPHVKQAGSMVGPHRLRFDFTHFSPVTSEEAAEIENLVNERILWNEAARTEVLSKDEAVKRGAVAFFGDKYGDVVRMLVLTPDSVELCGGTHVKATGDIGLFKIVSEGSLASGVRRIEAMTGLDALHWVQERERLLMSVAGELNVGVSEVPARLEKLRRDHAALEKKLQAALAKQRAAGVADAAVETVGDVNVLALSVENVQGGALRDLADKARTRLGSGVALIVSQSGPKVALLITVTEDLTGRFAAGKLLSQVAPVVGGRGGGRPELAQGGGSDPSQIPAAIEKFKTLVAG